jgi:hypothetical protein
MKLIGFLGLIVGAILGAVGGYYVAQQNQPQSRLPTDISTTLLPDFDLKKVGEQLTPGEKDKVKPVWEILKDTPGKGALEEHRKFLRGYKQGSQPNTPAVLAIKSRTIVAQSKIPADEQNDYWVALYGQLASAITDLKINVATPGAGGRPVRSKDATGKFPDVRTAYIEYTHLPADQSPYPMRGVMHISWVADGDLVSLTITMTEVFHTT